MTRKTNLISVIAFAGLTFAGSAFADDGRLYWLGSIGKITPGNDKATFDEILNPGGNSKFSSSLSNGAVYDALIGWKFNSYMAIEGGYVGTASDETYKASEPGATAEANFRGEAFKLVGVGMLPLPANFGLLAKLGVAHTHLNESAEATIPGYFSGTLGSVGYSKDAITYGIGAKYQLPSQWFARVDADRYVFNSLAGTIRRTAFVIGGGYQW